MSSETRQPWTEGPWALGEENCGGGSNVRAVVTESAEGVVVGWTARVVIAGDEVVSDAEAEANARIMAAAPVMAEALALVIAPAEDVRNELRAVSAGCEAYVSALDEALATCRAALDLCGWRDDS